MGNGTIPPLMIDPAEAVTMRKFVTLSDMVRALQLKDAFWEHFKTLELFDLLPFIYAIGRVQGIREERARRRKEV